MLAFCRLALAASLVCVSAAADAATTIVDLNASATNPNAGHNSPGFAYNPVTLTLGPGAYTVGVVGVAGGGLYDAYSVYAPSAANAAWTDAGWSMTLDGGISAAYTQPGVGGTVADYDGRYKAGRYNSSSAAITAYAAAAPYTFTLASAQTVGFYVDDSFGDDSGGVSLAVTNVPEPASLTLLAVGIAATVFAARRRGGAGRPG